MNNHKHYQVAYNAHRNTSFSPDKRAQSACNEFDNDIATLRDKGTDDAKIVKYETLWLKWMNAKSRCASTMITGPANFAVARNEKANNAERKAGDECLEYYNKIIDHAKKEAFYAANPQAKPVMSGDSDALERLQDKLAAKIKAQETMKAVNVAIRKNDHAAIVNLLGCEEKAADILKPDFCGRIGFASYALNNNRAEIKRLEARINEIEKRKASTPKEITLNGVKVVENIEAMRLQVFFESKPAQDIIKLMKSNAFKWAPSVGAWQRQLTNNAIYSFNNFVMPRLKDMVAQ